MGFYPQLEMGDNHRLQHVAEVEFRLEKERDFTVSLYKKVNVVDGLDTALSAARADLAALDSCQQSSRCLSSLAFKLGEYF